MAQPLVFGAMKDKAVVEMLEALAPVAALTICTTAPTPRAMDADALAELARSTHAHVEVERDPFAAVARACAAGPRLGRRRGLDLPRRPGPRPTGPWYSAVIPGRVADRRTVMLRTGLLVLVVLAAMAWPAAAQEPPGGCKVWQTNSEQSFTITSTKHYRLIQNVEINCNDMQFFADEAEIFSDADRMRASGNVVFVSNDEPHLGRADGVQHADEDRDVLHRLGHREPGRTDAVDRSLFGTQEPDAYFWGETIEKLGPKTYRVTHGGFTTCVQPTPRWELVSDSVTLTLEKHAILKNAVLKVKGVPVFYLPVMYYPINKEDRATGFLIPTYGSSTIRGQTLSNAFFWAINRSQDATFYHDLYSKTGQGFGSEYRYIEGPERRGPRTSRSSTSTTRSTSSRTAAKASTPPAPAIRSAATWRSRCPGTCGSRPTPTTSRASARSSDTSRDCIS